MAASVSPACVKRQQLRFGSSAGRELIAQNFGDAAMQDLAGS
jgi:hypothetical protein